MAVNIQYPTSSTISNNVYFFKNVHLTITRPRVAKKHPKLHSSPMGWHDISHTWYIPYIIYPIQTIDKYSLNSRLPISNTNLYFPHPWTGCIICVLHISPVCPLYAHHMYPISFLHKMHIHFSGHRTNWWIIYSHYISPFCLHL